MEWKVSCVSGLFRFFSWQIHWAGGGLKLLLSLPLIADLLLTLLGVVSEPFRLFPLAKSVGCRWIQIPLTPPRFAPSCSTLHGVVAVPFRLFSWRIQWATGLLGLTYYFRLVSIVSACIASFVVFKLVTD